MQSFTIIFSAAMFAFILLILWREGLLGSRAQLVFAILFTAGAVIIRALCFEAQSDDYLTFLAPWTQYFRENGGFAALSSLPGNYNPPYMYFLAVFSYLNVSELYLIKALSVFFDVLLAWVCAELMTMFTKSDVRRLALFFAVLLLPTVMINGAYWAQCDSIYSFFGIWALYLGLRGKGNGAMAALAVCLGFKLQAVFIIPVFFVLLLAGRIKWRSVLVFPVVYIALMLPCVLAGASLWDTLTLYFTQAGSVGSGMNYNAPSFTSLFSWTGDTGTSAKLLIAAAFLLIFAGYAAAALFRRRLNSRVMLGFALIFVMGIPYLLPHMHDRYFYMAGVLALVLAASDLRFFLVPVFAELASLHCYLAYFRGYYYVQPRYGGELMAFALLMAGIYWLVYLIRGGKNEIYS